MQRYIKTVLFVSMTILANALALAAVDYTGQNLEGKDFTTEEFKDTDFTLSLFATKKVPNLISGRNMNFSGIDLSGTRFAATGSSNDYSGSNFSNAILNNVNFSFSNLENVNFTGAVIGTDPKIAPFTDDGKGTSFWNAKNLTFAQIQSTKSYQEGNLDGVRFGNIDYLTKENGWDFSNLSMQNTYLIQSIFTGVSFENSDLRKAELSKASLQGANLSGANLTGATVSGANFADADLSGATLTNLSFESTTVTGADFSEANLSGASFKDVDLTDVDFSGANFTGVNLTGATLKNTIMPDGSVSGLSLSTSSDRLSVRRVVNVNESSEFKGGSTLNFYCGDSATLNIANDKVLTLSNVNINVILLEGELSTSKTFTLIQSATDGIVYSEVCTKENIKNKITIKNIDGTIYDGYWNVVATNSALTVTVPEPSTYVLSFSILSILLLGLRRRK